jgi:hypothetical protein
VLVVSSGNGVYSDIGPSNVTLPLLLTLSVLYVLPKKFTANGRLTTGDEPSSFAGSSVAWQPPVVMTALGPTALAAPASAASNVSAAMATAKRSPRLLIVPLSSSRSTLMSDVPDRVEVGHCRLARERPGPRPGGNPQIDSREDRESACAATGSPQ